MERIKIDKGYYGAIEKYNHEDYIAGEFNFSNLKKINYEPKIQYHQPDVNNSACTIYSAIGILSNLFGIKISNQEIEKLIEKARKENPPFVDGKGWRLYKAVDLVRRRWNAKHPNQQVITYYVGMFGIDFYEFVQKGYPVQTGIKVNREYWKDKKDDCSINGTIKGVSEGNIGHSIITYLTDKKKFVQDSYSKYKCNIYSLELEENKLKELFFKGGYAWVPKENILSELEKDINIVKKWYEKQRTKNYENVKNIEKGNYTQDVKTILLIERRIEGYKKEKK